MVKILHKLFFTVISTAWIIIVYAIDQKWNCFKDSYVITAIILICIPFVLTFLWYLCIRICHTEDNITACNDIDEVNNDFLANYLGYFFIGIGLENFQTLILVYIIVSVFTFVSQTQFFNPMLLLMGYKYYYVTTPEGTKVMIISRRIYINANQLSTENLKRLCDNTFIEYGG